MAKWSMDLEKYAKAKGEQIDTIRRTIAVETYKGVTEMTPVDTGRARGNWQISVGHDTETQLERFGDSSSEELPKLQSVHKDETIYICNNVEYAEALEYGHSQQAPQGMLGVTMARINANIKKYVEDSK